MRGDTDGMIDAVSDEMIEAFAVVGTPDEARREAGGLRRSRGQHLPDAARPAHRPGGDGEIPGSFADHVRPLVRGRLTCRLRRHETAREGVHGQSCVRS